MAMTDPIADMLTRIRNANSVYHEKVEIPASKIKVAIADVLKREGFIRDYSFVDDDKQGILSVKLKYGADREKVITGKQVFFFLSRISLTITLGGMSNDWCNS